MDAASIPVAQVSSYSDVRQFLERLPAPATGRKRMLRGQTRGYVADNGFPNLLPALARENSDHTYDPAWLISVQMYSMEVEKDTASTPYDQVYLWGPALLQHYGPGSCYLDVTSDLDVALWFALNKRWERWLAVEEPSGIPRSHCFAWYTHIDQADPGVEPILYIFDSASWSGSGSPAHGELVELTSLDVAGNLPQEARRLHEQVGSLLYSDLKHDGGPNLGTEVIAMVRFTRDFDKSTVPSYGRSVAEVFPPPATDPFYKALLQIPAQLQCDPRRIEHPLAIPCYLTEPPHFPESSDKGNRRQPLKLSLAEADGIRGFSSFSELGHALNPLLMFQFAVQHSESFGEPVVPRDNAGREYRLIDATPFLMEGPLWSYLPNCHTEESRGQWIQSALPIGIAAQLANRPTDNVYIEMSTIDVQYPQKGEVDPASYSAVRGIWIVRSGTHYMCTVYRTGDGGIFSMAFPFRFIPQTGQFIRVAPEAENSLTQAERDNLQPHLDVAEKALYTGLLLLRELSPGFKPPSTFAVSFLCRDDSMARLVGEVLEPQLGVIHTSEDTPFLIPRALNGSIYARSSGADSIDRNAWKKTDDGLLALINAFRTVKEPLYLIDAGVKLTELLVEKQQFRPALDVVRYALAQTTPVNQSTERFAASLELLQGSILLSLNDRPNSMRAYSRAIALQKQAGDEDKATDTQNLMNGLFGVP